MFRPVNAQPVQFLPLQSTGRAVAVVLLAESGRVEQARIALGMLREWVAEAASIDGYSDLGAVDWAASRLALATGDRQAAASWRAVPAAEAAFGLPFLEAWLAIDFAQARRADADEDAARRSLHRAQLLLARFVDPAGFGDRLRAVGAPLGIAPFARVAVRESTMELSERELSVLQLLDSALSAREIAAHLFVSPNTLKTHVRAVYRKLGVNSRHSAVRAARERGLIHPVG
jgi:LuxR family maltose regulon positive regulatory protein